MEYFQFKLIQWILLPFLLLLMGIFFQKLRRQPRMRILVMGIMLAGVFFLLFPDSSTLIAQELGIGRGVDLIIYLSLLGLTVSCVLLYLRTLHLQEQLTTVVQRQAVQEARDQRSVEKNT